MRFVIPWLRNLHQDVQDRLAGAPDFVLSVIMLGVAGLLVWGAFRLPAEGKAAMILWTVLP